MIRTTFGAAAVLGAWLTPCAATDWPFWRGPEQTGMTREKAPVTTWSQEGENLLWKVPLGGRTTPIVMNGRVFLIGPVGEGIARQERVFCLDSETGKTLWEYQFNVFHTDIVENRVGWTSLVGDPTSGYVYAHGTGGELFCFDRDGKILWKRSLTEEFGRISGYGGRLHTPVIDEDRLIIGFSNSSWGDQAAPRHRLLVLDKKNGSVLWWAAPGDMPADLTVYATPVIAIVDGVRTLVWANGEGNVYGLRARTGEQLWVFKLSKRGLNSTPVVDGNFVYVGHSEENLDTTEMGRVVCIDATGRGDITATGERWRVDGLGAGYASLAIANGRLYAVDNSANLHCLDAPTGKRLWTHNLGRVGKGSPVVTADGVIYVGEQNGVFHILKDAGDKCVSLDQEEFTRSDNFLDELYGSPAVANGRVYFMTRYHTYCLGVKTPSVSVAIAPPKSREMPLPTGADGTVHIVPAEVTLRPGDGLKFFARQFTSEVHVRQLKPTWSFSGVQGTISASGNFEAASDNKFSAGYVIAQGDGFVAKARVRISPEPPIDVNFEDMAVDSVPPGWIGVAKRTKIVERDGGKVLQKLAEDPAPPFMRIQPYITPPIAGGYLMQADMLGTPKGDLFRPDMGLVNSRYTLSMLGGDQALRLETWPSLPRLRKDVPFPWVTDKWYRMKFEVKLQGDRALLRGKVWPRDDTEPTAWTIETEDPYPNHEGSPGLYGFSPGTTTKSKGPEIFYDNLKVTRNE